MEVFSLHELQDNIICKDSKYIMRCCYFLFVYKRISFKPKFVTRENVVVLLCITIMCSCVVLITNKE